MTFRERTSLLLVAVGVVLAVIAAAMYDGYRGAVGMLGVLMIGGGVLLGLDSDEAEMRPVEPDDDLEQAP